MNYKPLKRILLLQVAAILATLGLSAQGMYIKRACRVVMTGSVNIVFNNMGLNNNAGSIAPGNSNIIFTGTNGAFIEGVSIGTNFNNLTINKSAGDVPANGNFSVLGNLTMNNGNLLLKNHTIVSLNGTGSIVNESGQSHIMGVGSISTQVNLNAPAAVNAGNMGIELTTPVNLGVTVVTRSLEPVSLSNGITGIGRTYTVTPDANVNTGLNATVRYHYLDAELGNHNENAFVLWSNISAWLPGVNSTTDITANTITQSGIDQFGSFTASEAPAAFARKTTTAADNTFSGKTGVFSVQVLPNPTHDRFTLVLTPEEEKDDVISLYNLSGRLLQRKKIHYEPGPNYIEWDMSAYAAGFYYLHSEKQVFKDIKIVRQ